MAENWDYISRDQAIDEAIELRTAIENHECDHTDCIPRSELPGLPSHYKRPFMVHHYAQWGDYCWQVTDQETQLFAECESEVDAEILRDILNTCYPSPTATKEG